MIDRWSTALFGAVLSVYLAMTSASAMPGRSADLIVKALGLEPKLSPASSLWFAIVHPLTLLPNPVLALNLFSALCAFACVCLTGWILWRVVLLWTAEKLLSREDGKRLARTAALAGSVALAFSPPFWSAALRADTGTFDCLLLLVWLVLCLRFVLSLEIRWAYAAMAWAGIGASQTIAFLWLAPLALAGFFTQLPRDVRTRVRVMTTLIALLALPYLLVTVIQSAFFIGTTGHALTGSLPLLQVAIELGWGQLRLMRQGVTSEGWLLGFIVAIAPWLACAGLLIKPRRKRTTLERGTVSDRPGLHIMATVAVLGVFVNAPFSIWAIYGDRCTWLTPAVLSAMTFGWLASYWHRFALGMPSLTLRKKPPLLLPVHQLALGLLALTLTVGILTNSPTSDRALRSLVSSYARTIIEALGQRPWLITGGTLDSAIAIEAHNRGRPLRTLNVLRMNDSRYREYKAGHFSDLQISNACQIGMSSLVREWFGQPSSNLASQVAILALPDLWYAAGLQPEPNVLVFVGSAAQPAEAVSSVWARNTNGWARLKPLLTAATNDPPAVALFKKQGRRHVSYVANNTGVWLEERGQPKLAGEAYVLARSFEPYNVSALLNLGALVRQGAYTNNAPAILAELKNLTDAKPKLTWWSLTRQYGYVRNADAYAALGHAWALSGQPGITASGLRHAVTLSGDEKKNDEKKAILAQLYLREGKLAESRALLEQRLLEQPDDANTLIGLAQLALATNDVASAASWLRRADKPSLLKEGLDLVVAGLYNRIGDLGHARVLAQAAIDRSYDNLPAWAILASVALGQRDTKTLELCKREIQRLEKGRNFNGVLVEALLALDKGETKQARLLFDEALRLRPKSIEVMERLLRLDLLLGLREATPALARFLISLDGRNPIAPYILGIAEMKARNWSAARPWLEQSLDLQPAPEVLNDLAWTLLQLGELASAETRAREAVARAPSFTAAWDTLGMILAQAGRHDEAVSAFERVIASGGRRPLYLAHLARARLGLGDTATARLLLQEAVSVKRALTPQEEEEIRAVRQLIKGK